MNISRVPKARRVPMVPRAARYLVAAAAALLAAVPAAGCARSGAAPPEPPPASPAADADPGEPVAGPGLCHSGSGSRGPNGQGGGRAPEREGPRGLRGVSLQGEAGGLSVGG